MEKSQADFKAAILNLESGLRECKRNKEMYRLVATQLSILLCDKDPLLPRLFPKLRLHPLLVKPKEKMDTKKKIGKDKYHLEFTFLIPGLMQTKRNKLKVVTIFNEAKPKIKFKYWINQPLFSLDFTLRDFIKLIRNKEGAHSDPETPYRLRTTKKFFIQDDDINYVYIIKIGEYVLKQCKILEKQLNSANKEPSR